MELLEAALKHSLEWSMGGTRLLEARSGELGNSENQRIQAELEQESQVRAFVSRFKIELNHLMGVKWMRESAELGGGQLDESTTTTTTTTTTTSATDEEEHGASVGLYGRPARIRLSGKYSGVYQIGNDEDDGPEVESDDEVDTELSAAMARCSLASMERSLQQQQQRPGCIDDGYRSLSRGSGSLQRQDSRIGGATVRARASLLQQLNDIKSRVVDLVHEIDQYTLAAGAPTSLGQDELEAYRRRKDALLHKLDLLIERQQAGGALQTSPNGGHLQEDCGQEAGWSSRLEGGASNRDSDDGYEEQIQVIDYDFSRRANELSRSKQLRTQDKELGPNCASVAPNSQASTRLSVFCAQIGAQNPSPSLGVQKAAPQLKIDFGAMMRDYEERRASAGPSQLKVAGTQHTQTKTHHQASSSSASSYSNKSSSSTSSSSFI